MLFRKATTFRRRDDGIKDAAQREADVLMMVKDLKHSNIVDVLFAFEETISPEEAITNLVFPYCEFDLRDLLYDKSPAEVHKFFRSINSGGSLLDHGLWEAVVHVVDAANEVHNYVSKKIKLAPNERVAGGHFDIKPANIIVDTKGPTGRLLLTDFGNAMLKVCSDDQTSGREGIRATADYAGPESHSDKVKKSYDVWSLGCVLLEVLVFVLFSVTDDARDKVDQFYLDRRSESSARRTDAAYWIRSDEDDSISLRQSVNARLDRLRTFPSHDRGQLVRAVGQIKDMLGTDPDSRPDLSECLDRFQGVDGVDGRVFLSEAHLPLMPSLKEMYATQSQTKNSVFDLTNLVGLGRRCSPATCSNDR